MRKYTSVRIWKMLKILLGIIFILPKDTTSFYCDPPIAAPTGDGTTTKTLGGKLRSDNRVTLNTVRWIIGCNGFKSSYITYQALKAHYQAHEDERKKNAFKFLARPAPFCVTQDHFEGTKLERFKQIFVEISETINDVSKPERLHQQLPIWDPNDVEMRNKIGLQRLSFIRIGTPETRVPYLRQWFHIKMIFKDEIEGLYIQPISAPLGLPFGEFRIDFNCQDYKDSSGVPIDFKTFYEDPGIIPCKYRPRSAMRHPHVFVFGGKVKTPGIRPRKEFHVHFNWVDAQCSDAIVMQFLFLAVKKFDTKDYILFKSPSYEHVEFDSRDALPYPYYFGWKDKMTCNGEEMEPSSPALFDSQDNDNSVYFDEPINLEKENYQNDLDISYQKNYEPILDITEEIKNNIIENFDEEDYQKNDPILDITEEINWSEIKNTKDDILLKSFSNESIIQKNRPGSHRHMTNAFRIRRDIVTSCWNKDTCIMSQFRAVKSHIFYNNEYDKCITNLDISGLENGKTCPPGPFRCTKAAGNINERNKKRGELIEVIRINNCYLPEDRDIFHNRDKPFPPKPGPPPPDPFSTTLPPLAEKSELPYIDVLGGLELSGEKEFKENRRFHGWLMILANLVLLPGANFISRFYKETGADETGWFVFFGMPLWVSSHIALTYAGLLSIWVGMITLAGYPTGGTVNCTSLKMIEDDYMVCQKYESKHSSHVVLGGIAVALYHIQFINGWIRPKNATKRNCVLAWHCFGGYLSYFIAGISAMVGSSCGETTTEICLMMITSIGMFFLMSFVQKSQDRKLELTTPRKLFPVLEALETRENPPLGKTKLIILCVHWLLHLVLIALVILSYSSIGHDDSGDGSVGNINNRNYSFDKNTTYEFGGLIKNSCTALRSGYLHKKARCFQVTIDGCENIR